ncbi:MAG TPA: hypothetical protein VKT22_09450 [Steroidobacteraceae bacterium]|nr:hypothetical protein [Steroidobacteraceae bacterium]
MNTRSRNATSTAQAAAAGNATAGAPAIDWSQYLTVRVDPDDMVQYVHNLMTSPKLAELQWAGDISRARAAQLRWNALNRAFGDARVSTWTNSQQRNHIHVPAALIGAAGVAKLTLDEDEVVFDIPTLLDATLQLCEPVGNA